MSQRDNCSIRPVALTRRASVRHRAHQVRLGETGGVRVAECTIQPASPCANHTVAEAPWPHDCVIAGLRCGRRLLILHGDNIQLQAGDLLAVVAEGDALEPVSSDEGALAVGRNGMQ